MNKSQTIQISNHFSLLNCKSLRQDVNMYIVLNKSYKGLILCLTGLSDKYKCQQATRIINKHLQTNRSKYNITKASFKT